jgi:hypothetical protein
MFFSKTTLALALATNLSFLSSSTLAAEHGAKQRMHRVQRRNLKSSKSSSSKSATPPKNKCKKLKKLLKKTAFWEIISGSDGRIDLDSGVGSKLFINGGVYSDTDFINPSVTVEPSGTYNQMCTLAKDLGTSIENFCEYNFCLDLGEDDKGCIMLRSGGPYDLDLTSFPPKNIPDIDTFVSGGTGCFKGIQGSAMIEAIDASSCEGGNCPTPSIRDTFLKLELEHVVSSNSMMV